MTRILITWAVLGCLLLIPLPTVAAHADAFCPTLVKRVPEGKAGPTSGATPVLLVHGVLTFDERDANWPGPSPSDPANPGIVSRLNTKGPVPVDTYIFDYHQKPLNWVTDPDIGPKLAQGIMCLSRSYGSKVVVIGFSMGGLAARYAAGLDAAEVKDAEGNPYCTEGKVADYLAAVITIGTPSKGAPLASLLNGSPSADPAFLALFSVCTAAGALHIQELSPCPPSVVQGTALPGLAQISPLRDALTAWPSNLKVHVIGGKFKPAFYILDWQVPASWIGDGIVPLDSALAGGNDGSPNTVTCPIADPEGSPGLAPRLYRFGRLLNAVVHSKCFHSGLPNVLGVVNDVVSQTISAAKDTRTGQVGQGTCLISPPAAPSGPRVPPVPAPAPAPASPVQPPIRRNPGIGVSISSGPPGSTVTVGGSGWTPDQPVTISQTGPNANGGEATITADPAGQFEVTFQIADGTQPGLLTIRAHQAPDLNASAPFMVTPGAR
jgi:hypothetical protein